MGCEEVGPYPQTPSRERGNAVLPGNIITPLLLNIGVPLVPVVVLLGNFVVFCEIYGLGVGTADLDAGGMGRAAGVEDGSRQAEDQQHRTKAHLSTFAITFHQLFSYSLCENHPWKCEST